MANENRRKNELETLTEIFRQAGAPRPETWAESQINEGINQLARFSFLKNITSEWLKENEYGWIDKMINGLDAASDVPCSQFGTAVKEMLEKNVSKEAIVDLIRVVQFETLYHVCSTIDKTYEVTTPVTNWRLFELDDDDNPVATIGNLHESLLQFDPSGREMGPRTN